MISNEKISIKSQAQEVSLMNSTKYIKGQCRETLFKENLSKNRRGANTVQSIIYDQY